MTTPSEDRFNEAQESRQAGTTRLADLIQQGGTPVTRGMIDQVYAPIEAAHQARQRLDPDLRTKDVHNIADSVADEVRRVMRGEG